MTYALRLLRPAAYSFTASVDVSEMNDEKRWCWRQDWEVKVETMSNINLSGSNKMLMMTFASPSCPIDKKSYGLDNTVTEIRGSSVDKDMD